MQLTIQTNTFCNLNKYILHIPTNTFNLFTLSQNCHYFSLFGQQHLAISRQTHFDIEHMQLTIQTNTFCIFPQTPYIFTHSQNFHCSISGFHMQLKSKHPAEELVIKGLGFFYIFRKRAVFPLVFDQYFIQHLSSVSFSCGLLIFERTAYVLIFTDTAKAGRSQVKRGKPSQGWSERWGEEQARMIYWAQPCM